MGGTEFRMLKEFNELFIKHNMDERSDGHNDNAEDEE